MCWINCSGAVLPVLRPVPSCSKPVVCWNYWSCQCQEAPQGLETCQSRARLWWSWEQGVNWWGLAIVTLRVTCEECLRFHASRQQHPLCCSGGWEQQKFICNNVIFEITATLVKHFPRNVFLAMCCNMWPGKGRATKKQRGARTPGCHCSHQDGHLVYPVGIRCFSPHLAHPQALFSAVERALLCAFPMHPQITHVTFFSCIASLWLKVFFCLWMEEVNNSPDGLDEGAVCNEWTIITRLNLNTFLPSLGKHFVLIWVFNLTKHIKDRGWKRKCCCWCTVLIIVIGSQSWIFSNQQFSEAPKSDWNLKNLLWLVSWETDYSSKYFVFLI